MDVSNACTDSVSSVLVTRQVSERDTALGDTHSRGYFVVNAVHIWDLEGLVR